MDERLRRQVRERADNCCEYCRVLQGFDLLPFQVDHIIAEVHHGETALDNLAWSWFDCNIYKGPNLAGIDPLLGEVTRLYHPRQDHWDEHFVWMDSVIVGKTPSGRATIDVLRLSFPSRVQHRRLLRLLGEI
ncbi:MAG: HNH endonuclease signature motif containing protein [Pirellulales bacterium]